MNLDLQNKSTDSVHNRSITQQNSSGPVPRTRFASSYWNLLSRNVGVGTSCTRIGSLQPDYGAREAQLMDATQGRALGPNRRRVTKLWHVCERCHRIQQQKISSCKHRDAIQGPCHNLQKIEPTDCRRSARNSHITTHLVL